MDILKSQDNLEQSWPLYRYLLKLISRLIHIPSYKLNNYTRTIFCLILFSLLFPLTFLITLLTYILSKLFNTQSIARSTSNSKRILISGGSRTEVLYLCRAFYHTGHQIILIDEQNHWLTGHRWSNSVERFYVHPCPIRQPEDYRIILANIVRREKIDFFIPVLDSHINTEIKSALAVHGCSVFYDSNFINNKFLFINKADSFGLTVPKTYLITSRRQLLDFNFHTEPRSFICKPAISNQQLIIKLPRSTSTETIEYINKLSIDEIHPYILQEYIPGKEYSTFGICHQGELTLFTCYQFNSKHIEYPDIYQWCIQYTRALKLTGHISFNFIINDNDDKPYAIGCNSNINSSITKFYNHPNLVDAYFPEKLSLVISPLLTACEIYWFPETLWRIFRNIRSRKELIQCIKKILYGKEAIWSLNDPFPFLLHYHLHLFYLLLENLFSKHIRFFDQIDFSLGDLI